MKNKNWIWIGAGALAAVAATVFFIKKKNSSGEEKPPKKAPQLDIENPGSQSDFPTAPNPSEVG